jgi:hypothetical protein
MRIVGSILAHDAITLYLAIYSGTKEALESALDRLQSLI